MARQVTIAAGKSNIQLPNGQMYDAGDVVILTDAQYAELDQDLIPDTVIDDGVVAGLDDAVISQATTVAALPALTSVVAAGAAPTKAEYDALRADVVAVRTTIAAMLTALKGVGKPMSAT